jgi:hypothetical protein
MLRAEVYARALRASQKLKRAEVWVVQEGTYTTLDPEKKTDEQPLLLLVDTSIDSASPSHARQE